METVLDIYSEIEKNHPEAIEFKDLNRNEVLIKKGSIERYGYFVESGAVRVIHLTEEKEQNIRFGYKGSFITSLPSFFDNSPSPFSIEAIRKTRLKCFKKEYFFKTLKEADNGLDILLELVNSMVHQFANREIDLLTSSPKELYERVQERSPQLFQEIPALHIANYLGMSAEHLSRLRKS